MRTHGSTSFEPEVDAWEGTDWMTLVYRSVFKDADGTIVRSAESAFVEWLRAKGYDVSDDGLSDGMQVLPAPADVSVTVVRSSSSDGVGPALTRLRLVEDRETERWVTQATWPQADVPPGAQGTWLWVDLEHQPSAGQPVVRPGSPRFVRELMATGEATDGVVPLTSEPWRITTTHVAELIRFVAAPDRRVPVLVFASDARRAYDQNRLATQLARDLAGVAAVFQLVDGEATQRFAETVPDGYAVYAGALRTFLPGATGEGDEPSRHRILGRASLAALRARAFPAVKDQVLELSTRRATPSFAAAPSDAESVRKRADRPLRQVPGSEWIYRRLARLLTHLGRALPPMQTDPASVAEQFDFALDDVLDQSVAPADVVATATAAVDRVDRLEEQAAFYDALLGDADRERNELNDAVELLRMELEDVQLEATESVAERDQQDRRVRWLERRLRELGDAALGDDSDLPEAPASVAEVVEMARTHLPNLVIGDTDQAAAELDLYATSQMFAIKAWQALIALDAYARARSSDDFQGSFVAWCQDPPVGQPAISANAVASGESQSVDNNPNLHGARIFSVPTEVDPAGVAYMAAHVRVAKRTTPAPRLHYYDHAAISGKIYVGYLGGHLPTARFP